MKDLILMVLTMFLFVACLALFGAITGCVRPDGGTAPLQQYNYASPKLVDAEVPFFGELMPQDLANSELISEYAYYLNGASASSVPKTVRGIRLSDVNQYRTYCHRRAMVLEKHMRRRNLIK